jgi:hypothetical protein
MKHSYTPSRTLLLHAAVVLLAICAALGSASRAHLRPIGAAHGADLRLRHAVNFSIGMGAERALPAGSRWRVVGSLSQGTVYRPLNTVVVVEAHPAEEAYPVFKEEKLQGFFLPQQASFTPLRPAMWSSAVI